MSMDELYSDVNKFVENLIGNLPPTKKTMFINEMQRLARKHNIISGGRLFNNVQKVKDLQKIVLPPLQKEKEFEDIMKVLKDSIIDAPLVNVLLPADINSDITNSSMDEVITILNATNKSIKAGNTQSILLGALAEKFLLALNHHVPDNKFIATIDTKTEIKLSASYMYFLMNLYRFAEIFPKILKCTVSIHFLNKNFKTIKDKMREDEHYLFWKNNL
jgi:hypothetical protein